MMTKMNDTKNESSEHKKVIYANYELARQEAIDTLIDFPQQSIPIKVMELIEKVPYNIKLLSYQEIMLETKWTLNETIEFYGTQDGIAQKMGDRYIIAYNADKPVTRKRFTLAHELGHILLAHFDIVSDVRNLSQEQYAEFEKEANQFASQLLSPEPIIAKATKIKKPLCCIDVSNIFNISLDSAICVVNRINARNGMELYKEAEMNEKYQEDIQNDYDFAIENVNNITDVDTAIEVINTFADGYANSSTETIEEYEEALEAYNEEVSNFEKVISTIEELQSKFEVLSVSTSRKSISTYVRIAASFENYNTLTRLYDFEEDYYNELCDVNEEEDFNNMLEEYSITELEVRISNHEVGSYFNEFFGDTKYNDENVTVLI